MFKRKPKPEVLTQNDLGRWRVFKHADKFSASYVMTKYYNDGYMWFDDSALYATQTDAEHDAQVWAKDALRRGAPKVLVSEGKVQF